MTPKRVLLAAVTAACVALLTALPTPPARADSVGPTASQDQANRLSIFHDYNLDVLGNSTGDGGGVAAHGGGYLGEVPVPGSPGQGAAAGIIDHFSDRFTFLKGLQSTDGSGTGRSYDVSLGYGSGYDSNPEARRIPRDANFVGGDLSAAYHYTDGAVDPIVGAPLRADFSYTATGALYEGQDADADAIQQGLLATVRRSYFDNTLVVSSTLNDQFTMEHGAAFLDTFDAGASGEFFFTPQLSADVGYDFAHLQYYFKPTNVAAKPTADRNTFDARAHLYPLSQRRGAAIPEAPDVLTDILRDVLRRATAGYSHVWNRPDQRTGRDYRYESNRLYFGLEGLSIPDGVKVFGQSIGRGTTGSVLYAHEFQGFEFNNSASPVILAGRPRGGFSRKDGLDVFTLNITTRLLDFAHNRGNLTSYMQWDIIHDGSNITPRHFNEYVITSGLTYQY